MTMADKAPSPHLSTFQTYQSAWTLGVSADERQRLLGLSVAEDCVYQDPGIECRGHAELIAKIEDANQKGPGAKFRNDSFFEHHDQGVVNWTMFDGAGDEYGRGASYVRFGADGRLTHMTGFYDPPTRPFGVSTTSKP